MWILSHSVSNMPQDFYITQNGFQGSISSYRRWNAIITHYLPTTVHPVVRLSFMPLAHFMERQGLWITLIEGGRQLFASGVRDDMSARINPFLKPNLILGTEQTIRGVPTGRPNICSSHTTVVRCYLLAVQIRFARRDARRSDRRP